MNVFRPGSFLFIALTTLWSLPTEARVGRSPVASENDFTCAGAVSQVTNVSAALVRLLPLLKTTQLSGPEMLWCPADEPAKVGMICTPYGTWMVDRSHGPVTSMPILLALNRFVYLEFVLSM